MKTISLFVMVLLMFVYCLADDTDKNQLGKITFPIGDNFVKSAGKSKWKQAEYKMALHDRDKVKTAKQSRCEITFQNKKVMRVGENSIIEINKDEAGGEEVKMNKGRAWLSLFLPKGKNKFRMRTPSSVCGVRGTVYRLECDSNQTTFRCYQGSLAITPFEEDGETLSDSSFSVNAGEELILVMDFEEYKKQQLKAIEDFKQKEMDDFERFKQQDQEQFDDMVQKDYEAFQKMSNINYKQEKFDLKEDLKSDWVKWNQERDNLINK